MLRSGRHHADAPSSVVLPPTAKGCGTSSGHGRRLQLAERVRIEIGVAQQHSPDRIAAGLGVHRSTVFRELGRYSLIARDGRWGNDDTYYSAVLAQFWADQARARP
ncbi:helix-turn-helix domain-containing protein, partial [Tersicoccus sp. MR15.9]|uniref:helix-turn-helix domain-containing protein n=1 Tax=Tersicoccus mangrovi TaxID=3121635 RepID=UPI002FE65C66